MFGNYAEIKFNTKTGFKLSAINSISDRKQKAIVCFQKPSYDIMKGPVH